MKRLVVACGVAVMVSLAGVGSGLSAAQQCHYAYSGCLPIVGDLNCEDINWGVYQVYDVYDDPYGLDVLYGPGNGWTCDGIG